MSPKSRGRRPKKGGKRTPQKARLPTWHAPAPARSRLELALALGGGQRPDRFDAAIERVLAEATTLPDEEGPRHLEQRVAELLGAQMHAALRSGQSMWFSWWVGEVADAALDRVERDTGPDQRAAFWLLRGLAAQHELRGDLLRRADRAARQQQEWYAPKWLFKTSRIAATGEAARWEIRMRSPGPSRTRTTIASRPCSTPLACP